jgi:hypothetical protein
VHMRWERCGLLLGGRSIWTLTLPGGTGAGGGGSYNVIPESEGLHSRRRLLLKVRSIFDGIGLVV